MITTLTNSIVCSVGLGLGIYTLIRHLNALNHSKTPTAHAWLIAVGSLAWSVALFSSVSSMYALRTFESESIGLSRAEVLTNFLILIYWCGAVLQVQRYCTKLKIRRRKLSKQSKRRMT
ncbi:hypothetical protein [Moraxella canis]|uniref:hypothetical protein n=1 Tax=Moraxella canis TaxID=90239 RepID=UPI000667416E|nr:hypothetical protein [Moraxella canis]